MDDQNNANATPNAQSNEDVTQEDQTLPPSTDATPQNDANSQIGNTPADNTTQQADQTQPDMQTPSNPEDTTQEDDYIVNTGGSVVDLLEDVNGNDDLVQIVAQEMRLTPDNVRSILTPLLDKIHQGQITVEELALIMAAPVVDEMPEEPSAQQ